MTTPRAPGRVTCRGCGVKVPRSAVADVPGRGKLCSSCQIQAEGPALFDLAATDTEQARHDRESDVAGL